MHHWPMSQPSGLAAGLYPEPPVHRKPSETVTISILGLLLPTDQGKQLPQSDYRVPILVGLVGIGAGGCVGAARCLPPRDCPNCFRLFLMLPTSF